MSKFLNNIKEKLSRHKSSDPTSKQSLSPKTEANSSTGADTSLAQGLDHGKVREASSDEPSYSIQPHPAKTNDPADLQAPGTSGLRHGGPMDAFHARDPYVPNEQIRNNLPEPLSHAELQARQAALASEVPGHGTQQGNLL
ncbi:hypothetical protein M413DRAFT_443642 [Hebeloma cylindrosporum]|uniref:Uncharacterized protein n=1 Tax=Hebeloma cylindrosporum TaxID=76867 RepID=A0A0C2Y1L4_HEBCY|nr:hypothetical protein M413DRAFT_443642 [Hebeloma cylindrosporum h7]